MRTGDVLELTIEKMSFGPNAIARHLAPGAERPMVVFVEGGAPGDRVRARIKTTKKSFAEAEVIEILEPGAGRAKPECRYHGVCGGCDWMHLSHEAQIEAKTEILNHAIKKALRSAGQSADDAPALRKEHGTFLGWRARIQVRGDAEGLGFFARGSRDLVRVDRCIVAHPKIQEKWREFVTTKPLAQLAENQGQFKIEWTVTETGQVHEAINREHAALGFTQVNPAMNDVLRKIVTDAARTAKGKRLLLDLFGGTGNLVQKLETRFEAIASVDTHNAGVEPSEVESPRGHVQIRMDSDAFLRGKYWRDWGFETPDCVIADPPRSGLEGAAASLRDLGAPLLILVSCDPSTLGRDLTTLLARYKIREAHLVDMFPNTHHLESVVVLDAAN